MAHIWSVGFEYINQLLPVLSSASFDVVFI